MRASVDTGDLYGRYGGLVRALYSSRLDEQEVDDAVAETFATVHARRDAFEGASEHDVRVWFSNEVFQCFKAVLTTSSTAQQAQLADAILIQGALRDAPDPDNPLWGHVLVDEHGYWWDHLEVESDPSRDVAMLAEDRAIRHESLYRPIVADATRTDQDVLAAYLETLARGKASELAPSELLAPFSRPAVLGPDGVPLGGEALGEIQLSARAVSAELLRLLAREPMLLHKLTPRQFEEVMAELFARQGYEVTLTAATRDGGADLLVVDNRSIGSFLYVVECKKYRPDRPVGVGVVRQLFGVVQATRATAGILATTSQFTGPALRLQRDLQYQLALRDFAALRAWLRG